MESEQLPAHDADDWPAGWHFDQQECVATHTSGLVVRFSVSDTFPGAVIGEVLDNGLNDSPTRLLQQAGMLYAQLRQGRH